MSLMTWRPFIFLTNSTLAHLCLPEEDVPAENVLQRQRDTVVRYSVVNHSVQLHRTLQPRLIS
jgi:hypothetical protein